MRFMPCLRTLLCTCVSALCLGSVAAQDLTLPLFSDSWQATFSNPALYGRTAGKVTVGLPGVSNDLYAENVTYNQLTATRNGRRVLDLDLLPDLLEEQNTLRNESTVETLGLALRGERLAFGVYHRLRARVQFDYPRTLAELVARGNGDFVGQTVEFAPGGYGTSYHEFGLGASLALTDNIHLGARVKYLSGVADVRTGPDPSLRLTTGEENFALTLDQDATLNSAGAVVYEGLDDVGLRDDILDFGTENFLGDNRGLAFDLGAFAEFGPLRLQVAANDLGASIDWREDVTNLRFRGTRTFTGLDVLADALNDSLSLATALDSLRVTFDPTESSEAYSADLPATYLVGAEYDLTERLTTGALLVHYARPVRSETALALSVRYRLIDALTVGLNYNARRSAAANLGGHLRLVLGPLDVLLATDNLLTVLNQKDNTAAGVRLGASLVFGRDED